MVEFCKDDFFDVNVFWNTPTPDVTDCFKNALLRPLPFLVLLVLFLFGLPGLRRARRPAHLVWLPISWIQLTKLVLVVVYGGLALSDLLYSAMGMENMPRPAIILLIGPITDILAAVLGIGMYWFEYEKLYYNNPAMFIYWLLSFVSLLLQSYSCIVNIANDTKLIPLFVAIITFNRAFVAAVSFVMCCFSQLQWLPMNAEFRAPPKLTEAERNRDPNAKRKKVRPPCPQETASPLGYVTFFWMMGLVLKGWKKPLEKDQLWGLTTGETSATVSGRILNLWRITYANWLSSHGPPSSKRVRWAIANDGTKSGSIIEASSGGDFEKDGDLSNGGAYGRDSSRATVEISVDVANGGVSGKGKSGGLKKGQKEGTEDIPPLRTVLFKVFWGDFLFSQIVLLLYLLVQYLGPLMLWFLISYMANKNMESWKGYLVGCLFFFSACAQSLFYQNGLHLCEKLTVRVRAAIIDLLYRKSLYVHPSATNSLGGGDIVNLLAVDLQRIQDTLQYIYLIWLTPLSVIFATIILFVQLGPSSFLGLFVMLLTFVLNFGFNYILEYIYFSNMLVKDKRVRFMSELLNGIKVIKLYAWEKPFLARLYQSRNEEHEWILKYSLAASIPYIVGTMISFFTTGITLLSYVHLDAEPKLTAAKVFVSFSVFQMLQIQIGLLPYTINLLSGALIATKRIAKFLALLEINPKNVDHIENKATKSYPIIVKDASFAWKLNSDPILKNVNIRVGKGQLVAVVGAVGSGKTSLVSAFLGDMEKLQGQVNIVCERIAYVSQQAWILNATVRDNILFGRPWNEKRYWNVVEACALKSDFTTLAAGDLTEIGERGLNLSGGQKQRVSLARAVYNDADLYIFDDPLSAVDVHVGKHLFEHVIGPTGCLARGGKTRVLVTHGVQYLPSCDFIICLGDCKIREQGTYNELLAAGNQFSRIIAAFNEGRDEEEEEEEEEAIEQPAPLPVVPPTMSRLPSHSNAASTLGALVSHQRPDIASYPVEQKLERATSRPRGYSKLQVMIEEEEKDTQGGLRQRVSSRVSEGRKRSASRSADGPAPAGPPPEENKDKSKLIADEEESTGMVKPKDYWWYLKSQGLILVIICFSSFFIYQGLQIFANIFLSTLEASNENSDAENNESEEVREARINNWKVYTYIYTGLSLLQTLFLFVMMISFSYMILASSKFIHTTILERLIRAPMSFFDTTPIGRTLNRFSKDLDMIDFMLPDSFKTFIIIIGQIFAIFVVVSYSTPEFLIVLVPVLAVTFFMLIIVLRTSRQLRRMENTTRSPVFSYVAATLEGRSVIRAYKVEEQFILDAARRTDENHIFNLNSFASNRLLGYLVDLAANVLILAAALISVSGRDDDSVNAGSTGLSVAYAMSICASANLMIRMMSDFEMNAVSIERTREYTTIPNEAPWDIEPTRPKPEWPETGYLSFVGYQTRYREGLDLVLKGLTVHIRPEEKVGICGRTGAGKSSLTLSLFRLIEATAGRIEIDGIHLEKLGLHQLRSRLTILPQDPVIFSGTLRFNLDPFRKHTDAEIWKSLESAYLKDYFMYGVGGIKKESQPGSREPAGSTSSAGSFEASPNSMPGGGLEFEVSEGGQNLSVGQRQLLCLARALLRRTKVLVLDEATAAVDIETDALIQQTIRREFKNCTVLTIAHRINTIIDADKILVLDMGKLKEFDSPANLIARGEASSFYQMVKEAGLLGLGRSQGQGQN